MPDTRRHRGPHPADAELFAPQQWPVLSRAVEHLSWLLTRGYASPSSLKLVGDRFDLTERQRTAVVRSSCTDAALADRQSRSVELQQIADRQLAVDGFNLLTTIEAALAGGVVLCGRDGCYRDMAGMHGSYRKVEETRPALLLIGEVLAASYPADVLWLLDRPVSNSGRLKQIILATAAEHGWPWQVDIVDDPDQLLRDDGESVVVSHDSWILDGGCAWLNLSRIVVERRITAANVLRLDGAAHGR